MACEFCSRGKRGYSQNNYNLFMNNYHPRNGIYRGSFYLSGGYSSPVRAVEYEHMKDSPKKSEAYSGHV